MTIGILLLFLFFVPMIVAMCRRHRNTAPIILVNLLLGWTCIGWLVALIWAFTDNVAPRTANEES